MEKQNFSELINKAKATNTIKTIQKVIPVKKEQSEEVQFSFYIEKKLLKQLKLKAIEKDKSLKFLINESIRSSLEVK